MISTNKHIDRLRTFIAKGGYKAGDRLPPERELSEQLGTTRVALRRALSQLEAENVIWRHVGKGTFIGPKPADPGIESFFGEGLKSMNAVVEMREIIEPATARLAAERARSTDIKRIRRFLDASRKTKDPEVFNRCCEELHKAIALASHNPLLLRLYEVLSPVQSLSEAVGEQPPLSQEEHDYYYAQHRDIVEAIADREPERAENLMRLHIGSVGADANVQASKHGREVQSRAPTNETATAAIFLPALESVAERFGETAFLVRLTDRGVEMVEAFLPSGGAGRTVVHPGSGLRPTACATAKVLAAYSRKPLDLGLARNEPRVIRGQGFAVSDDELDTGISCIAVPVGFRQGAPRHAIGLIGMKSRLRRRDLADYVQALQWAISAVASDVAETLGIDLPQLPSKRGQNIVRTMPPSTR